jgi:Zn-dependent peptidase ImmA (M78 family)
MTSSQPPTPPTEEEANAFAVELLMPESFVRREIQRIGGIDIDDEKTIKTLAKKFGVSPSLMAMRIGQLSK